MQESTTPNEIKEKPKIEKRSKRSAGILKRMLKDVSKIRFQLVSVVFMALIIISCNIFRRNFWAESSGTSAISR